MGRLHVLRGNREQLMAYLERYPEAQWLTLVIAEDESRSGETECAEFARPNEIRVLNGVPLFPELPNMVRVTVELVKQLLDDEKTLSD